MTIDRRSRLARASALLLAFMLAMSLSAAVLAEDLPGPPIGSFLPCDRPADPPRCVSVGNDATHYVYIDQSVPPGLDAAIRRSLAQDYEPTHLRMPVQSRITPATDVRVCRRLRRERGGRLGLLPC